MFCLNAKFVEEEGGQLVVASVLRGGQLGAKVHPQDVLRSVDGTSVTGMASKDVETLLGGALASEVRLGFYRPQHLDKPDETFQVTVTRVTSEMQDIQARVLRAILEEMACPAVDPSDLQKAPGASLWAQVLSGLNQFKLEPEALKSEVGLLKSEVEALKAELESMAGTNKNAQLLRELRDTVKGQQRQVEEAKAEAERHKEEAMAANRRIKELEEAVARDEAMVREAEQRIEDGVAEAKKREIKLGQEKVQAEEEAKTEKLKVQKLTEELSNTFEHWHKTEDELSVKLKDRDAVLEDLGNQIETLIKEKEKVEAAKGEFEKILGAAVAITISEDAKMGAGGKQERRKLQHEMALDICATLGVSARRIQVVGASKVEGGTHAGALKIDMQILPKSTSPLEPTAIELVERILNEVANQESRLREEVKFGEHMLLAEPTFPHALIQGLREQALMMDAQLSGGPPPPLLSRAAASSSSGSPYANTSLLKTSTSSAAAAASSRPHPDSPRDTLSVTGLGALRGVQSKTSGNNRNSPGSSRGGGTNPRSPMPPAYARSMRSPVLTALRITSCCLDLVARYSQYKPTQSQLGGGGRKRREVQRVARGRRG